MDIDEQIVALRKELIQPVVLVGLMGAGKTNLGQVLANKLSGSFIDADDVIVEREGMSIPDIFEQKGEEHFRDVEREVLIDLMKLHAVGGINNNKVQIIATGGGAFINSDTRNVIRQLGLSVFLEAELSVLLSRIGSGEGRPLFAGKDPVTVLKELIETRYPIYKSADMSVPSYDEPIEKTTDRVLNTLYSYFAG